MLLKGAESPFLYNQLGVDHVPVEHILVDINPETEIVVELISVATNAVEPILYSKISVELNIVDVIIVDSNIELILDLNL